MNFSIAEKLFELIKPYLVKIFPKLLENNLQIIVEKVKSQLRQDEIRNEPLLRAEGIIKTIHSVKFQPFAVAKLAIKHTSPALSDIEIENALKAIQKSGLSKEEIQDDFFSKNNDWLREFIKLSSKFSTEDAYKLWGEILAQEFHNKDSISFRTMQTIASLSHKECEEFKNLFPYIINDEYIARDFIKSSRQENFYFINNISSLEEVGLIKFVTLKQTLVPNRRKNKHPEFNFKTYTHSLIVKLENQITENNDGTRAIDLTQDPSIMVIKLTSTGKELYSALRAYSYDYQKTIQYLERIAHYYKQQKILSEVKYNIILNKK